MGKSHGTIGSCRSGSAALEWALRFLGFPGVPQSFGNALMLVLFSKKQNNPTRFQVQKRVYSIIVNIPPPPSKKQKNVGSRYPKTSKEVKVIKNTLLSTKNGWGSDRNPSTRGHGSIIGSITASGLVIWSVFRGGQASQALPLGACDLNLWREVKI